MNSPCLLPLLDLWISAPLTSVRARLAATSERTEPRFVLALDEEHRNSDGRHNERQREGH